ncbi:YdcF family protein [Anaerovorax odorimutans]|uniref:YdcF family protein n=1 Tax=Anaerovorax odorimutans TaxID=109327 RepID=UPI0004000D1D|nr:YdcF family protein [Anaerovorax odorimutans]
MKVKLRKCKKIFYILFIIIICYVTYTSVDIYLYGNVNELVKADAAIVLGAAVWQDKPSPVFEERIKHGIWLYKNNYVDKLIFTGGKGDGNLISEAIAAKNYALKNSVPDEDIFIEEKSKITQENICYAAEIAKDNNISSVIIVSDPLHMRRAMLMAKNYGLSAYSSPTPTTKIISAKSKLLFLSREVFYYIGYKLYILF